MLHLLLSSSSISNADEENDHFNHERKVTQSVVFVDQFRSHANQGFIPATYPLQNQPCFVRFLSDERHQTLVHQAASVELGSSGTFAAKITNVCDR